MNGNGNYLEWKTIKVDNSDDETIEKPARKARALGESKSLPSSSNSSHTQTSSSSSVTNVSSMIKIEILKPKVENEQDRNSFASNTIKRYSRFRAKQDKKDHPKPRPKSLDSNHIYANLAFAVDKKTLVQTWINKTPDQIHTDKEVITNGSGAIANVKSASKSKSLSIQTYLEKQEEDDDVPLELRCPVCLDLYQKPLFLPCGHTYCKGCIQKVVDSSDRETKRKQRFVCPTCRNIIKYGNEGIDALPKNLNLECAVKRYETGHGVKAPMCQTHIKYRQEKVIWCEDCSCCICPLCIFDGNHQHHQVAPINVMTQFQRVRKKLKKTKLVLAGRVDDLQQSLKQMEKNRDDLDTKCSDMSKKIDKECQSMILLIKKQHQDMYKQMEGAIAKKHKKKQRQIATITSDIDRTNSMLTEIQGILDTEQPTVFLEKVKMSKIIDGDSPSLQSTVQPEQCSATKPQCNQRAAPKIPASKTAVSKRPKELMKSFEI